ncbi:hypothetical protein [Chromobacterium sphagni]|nr:hypothetical protein [Chromobacterium sphagni]
MKSVELTACRSEGFAPRIPQDVLLQPDLLEMGLAGELPPEARDEEEDARWACLPFLQLAVERMCVMALLAEDHEVDFSPLDGEALPQMRRKAADPVFSRAAEDYLAALATLGSMSGRDEGELHRSIAGLYRRGGR